MSEPAPVTPTSMWEQRYAASHYVFGTEPNDFLRAQVSALPAGEVLCLAEGEGRNSVFLAGQGYVVSSFDLSEAGVAKTRLLAAERHATVNAAVGDLSVVDIGTDRWMGIVSIFAHMPPKVRRGLHSRVVAALAPGGVFLLEAYTPAQVGRGTGGPSDPAMTPTLELLRGELDGLEFLHGVELEREVIEGSGHSGLASVVQVIARRPR